MHFDSDHPDNRGVLEYLCRNRPGRTPSLEPVTGGSAPNPAAGSHPEIVDYLWETLAPRLPVECRALVCGRSCLVEPGRGLIFAVPLGTAYALRLPPTERALALAAGAEVVHHYSTVGVTLDAAQQFGPHWVFGTFDPREPAWCRAALKFAEGSEGSAEAPEL